MRRERKLKMVLLVVDTQTAMMIKRLFPMCKN